jgi:hypothetical protein
MFRHQMCHPQGACCVILPNYVTLLQFYKHNYNKYIKLLGCYMFLHQMCHHQGACFVTLPNYMSTIAAELQLYLSRDSNP